MDPSTTTATLDWNMMPDVDQYQITCNEGIITLKQDVTEHTLENLSPDQEYQVEIVAMKGEFKGPTVVCSFQTNGTKLYQFLITYACF